MLLWVLQSFYFSHMSSTVVWQNSATLLSNSYYTVATDVEYHKHANILIPILILMLITVFKFYVSCFVSDVAHSYSTRDAFV